jgi:membrane peptidoglycan carboxypeptidase
VLRLMRQEQHISDDDLRAALTSPLPHESHRYAATIHTQSVDGAKGQYFQEEVRRRLFAMFGAERVLQGGLRVHSTYDPRLQAAAEEAVTSRIAQIAKRRRGATDLQGSLVAIDPRRRSVRCTPTHH